MKVKYTEGPASRTISSTGQVALRGEALDVSDEVGKKLLEQGWEAGSKTVKTPARTEAAKTPDPVVKENK